MPDRIHRQRSMGWRMPENTIYVGRPSRWGNPFVVAAAKDMWAVQYRGTNLVRWDTRELAAADAVDRFRRQVTASHGWVESARQALGGKNLACFCPPGQPCHADVLLQLANPIEEER